MKLVIGVAVAVLALALGACSELEEEKNLKGPASSGAGGERAKSQSDGSPDGKFSLQCDYLLGDFSESESGYRFVAGGDIENTGDTGIVVRVQAKWELLGSEPVIASEKRRLQPGQSANVQMTEVATSDQIDAHQSANGDCEVDATIIKAF